jgi:hypothetical protein
MKKMVDGITQFNTSLTNSEKELLNGWRTPAQVQAFLDNTVYPAGDENRSPLEVLRMRTAHCLDGGLFAAAILRRLGFPPLILDLQPDPGKDDDHVLALFRIDDCWGAVAKSNYSGLRYREPVYRTLRELVMSYFEHFFNTKRQKTLRYYSRVINLARFDDSGWMVDPAGVDCIEDYLKNVDLKALLTTDQIARLSTVDQRSYEAGTLGTNPDGVFKPLE